MTTTSFHRPHGTDRDDSTAPLAGARTVPRLRFGTQFAVELRKLTDTRNSRVLLGGSVLLTVGLLLWKLVNVSVIEVTFARYLASARPSIMFLVPLLGLLAMTGEWTQRTALTTFTMSPRRLRVFGAKFLASLTLTFAVVVVTLAVTFGATALGGALSDGGAVYHDVGNEIRSTVIAAGLQVLMGAAFGAIVPITAAAIGAFFVAPTFWSAFAPEVLKDNARWLDIYEAYDRLGTTHPGHHLAQTLTAVAAWIVVPAVLGLARSVRREVK